MATGRGRWWCAGRCLLFAAAVSGEAGCSGSGTAMPQAGGVVAAHQFLAAASAGAKQMGEDCTTAGPGDYASGFCSHFQADPTRGYACTARCNPDRGDHDCPLGWGCGSIYPAPGYAFCAPPRDWVPQVATARSSRSSQ